MGCGCSVMLTMGRTSNLTEALGNELNGAPDLA